MAEDGELLDVVETDQPCYACMLGGAGRPAAVHAHLPDIGLGRAAGRARRRHVVDDQVEPARRLPVILHRHLILGLARAATSAYLPAAYAEDGFVHCSPTDEVMLASPTPLRDSAASWRSASSTSRRQRRPGRGRRLRARRWWSRGPRGPRREGVRVLAAVLLVVHDHHVRRQLHDGRDVRILGASDRPEVGLLRRTASRRPGAIPQDRSGLGDRGHQADDPLGPRRERGPTVASGAAASQPPSSLCFCASNSAWVIVPRWNSPSSFSSSSATPHRGRGGGRRAAGRRGGIGVAGAAPVARRGARRGADGRPRSARG